MRPFTDLVVPHGNEDRLIEMAKHLGFRELLLCYEATDPLLRERVKDAQGRSTQELKVSAVAFAQDQKGIDKARALCPIVAPASPTIFEDKRVRYVVGMETGSRDDFVHHRNAGLTQVSVAEAMRTGKTLLVDIGPLLREEIPAPVFLGRMFQNNVLFRKYGPDVLVVSGAREPLMMRAPRDLQHFLSL